MRTMITLVALLALSIPYVASSQEEVATLLPSKPKVGDTITITYHSAAKRAVLHGASEVTAQVMLMREDENPQAITVHLKSQGSDWVGAFALKDKGAKLVLCLFQSGKTNDDNDGNVWTTLVYTAGGRPVRGAYFELGSLYRSGGLLDFRHQKDLALAKKNADLELALYPDNVSASVMKWTIMMRETPGDSTKKVIARELDKTYVANKKKDEAVAVLLPVFEQVGEQEKAERIRKEAIAAAPKGKVAQSSALAAAYRETDPLRRAEMLEKYAANFPLKRQMKEQVEGMIAISCAQARDYDRAEKVLAGIRKPDPMLFNEIAWPLIEHGEELQRAIAWAKKGVDLLRAADSTAKPSYMTDAQWEENRKESLGMILDTYALGLAKSGNMPEALKCYAEAFTLTKGGQPDVNGRYIEALLASGDATKAREVSREALKAGGANDKIMDLYKQSYTKVEGSDKGFETEVEGIRTAGREEMKAKLSKERINRPAADFALAGLDGKTVRLSELKGKVVVLDFWATWCGPCKASFPTLQKIYDSYKDNPAVAIYALDTWERESGQKRIDLVKKFLEDNKYSFPVLFDTDVVDKYGVTGIPTKFIIDRKGMLQFQSIGFSGPDQMESELRAQLDLLLSEHDAR